jgi:nifR3 family TIM-barrel protein
MLPWFYDQFPLYLAPMAGVTDTVFRKLVKERGADVLVTEFVSAEGVFHKNDRTRRYVEFDHSQRPVGVQIFGGDAGTMGDAARRVIDWVAPDFIDINFGCPVNKVVSKNGGSSLLRDCPLLTRVAGSVVKASAPLPVTAKMRIGWDANTINAVDVARSLEDCGVTAIAVHGRTKEQGYSGRADWDVIAAVAAAVQVPVIGNGDLSSPMEVLERKRESGVRGVMIGRAAMGSPWIFEQTRAALDGTPPPAQPTLEQRWEFIRRHCQLAVEYRGREHAAMSSMRARLMSYTKGMPDAKELRSAFSLVSSLVELDSIIERSLASQSIPT